MSTYQNLRAEGRGRQYLPELKRSIAAFRDRSGEEEDVVEILRQYFWASFPEQCLKALRRKDGYDGDWESYILHYDQIVNDSLRRGGPMEGKGLNTALNLVQALSYMPDSRKSITLFRGVAETEEYSLSGIKVGDVKFDKGFSSKTHNMATAANFTDGKCCMFMLRYRPGHKFLAFHPQAVRNPERMLTALEEYEIMTYPGEKFRVVDIFPLSFSYGEPDFGTETVYRNLKVIVMDYVGNYYQEERSAEPLARSIARKIDALYDESFDDLMEEVVGRLERVMLAHPEWSYSLAEKPHPPPGKYSPSLKIFDGYSEERLEALEKIAYFFPECLVYEMRGLESFLRAYNDEYIRGVHPTVQFTEKDGSEMESRSVSTAALRIMLQENRVREMFRDESGEKIDFPAWEGPL